MGSKPKPNGTNARKKFEEALSQTGLSAELFFFRAAKNHARHVTVGQIDQMAENYRKEFNYFFEQFVLTEVNAVLEKSRPRRHFATTRETYEHTA